MRLFKPSCQRGENEFRPPPRQIVPATIKVRASVVVIVKGLWQLITPHDATPRQTQFRLYVPCRDRGHHKDNKSIFRPAPLEPYEPRFVVHAPLRIRPACPASEFGSLVLSWLLPCFELYRCLLLVAYFSLLSNQ